MALLPLVEISTAPPIVPGYDMLHPVIQFSHWHVYSDNCSCLIEEHSRTMAVIRLSCACKHTDRDLKVMMCTVTPLLDKQPWRAVRIDTLVLCV